jgi:hypothetical protein
MISNEIGVPNRKVQKLSCFPKKTTKILRGENSAYFCL